MSDAEPIERAADPPVFDLFSEADPARNRLLMLEPILQRINERFVRNLRSALLQHLRRGVVISQAELTVVEHRELLEKLGSPTHLTLFTMKPLRGVVVLMIDAPLVVSLVESRFGGSGRFPASVTNREFTAFELKSMRRVVETALEQFIIAWEPLGRFEIGPLRHETNPQFAGFAHAEDQILASTFEVAVDQNKGKIAIYVPYAAIEPLQDQLMAGLVADVGDHDQRWSDTLRNSVQQASITLNVELGKIDISVGDLIGLRPGNVFEMDRPDSLVVEANGVPLFRGRWGRHGRKIGVLVEERVAASEERAQPARRDKRGNA
ncbi:MAG TPA: FliM/FliN family flagellar motor switch protein [Stellaceae bacterium]|jgi:flagellar motor switch protein FliM|nr:FliM/FliN family flagellar motor switch protein [Stellaceae bacterium]